MRWTNVFLTLVWALAPLAAHGAEPRPAAPLLRSAARNHWVRFALVGGRVQTSFDSGAVGGIGTSSTSGSISERFRLAEDAGQPYVTYERKTGSERLQVEARGSEFMKIEWQSQVDGRPWLVTFLQDGRKPLELKLGPPEKRTEFSGATVWHLLLKHPAECQAYLVPLLDLFDAQTNYQTTSAAVEKELLRTAAAPLSRDRWAAWIAQLGADEFTKREAADRNLRAAGPLLIGYLEHLDWRQLDAEQQFRVRRILTALNEGLQAARPEAVAGWLGGDPTVWLALMARSDLETRTIAARRLAELLGRPVEFDPRAEAAIRARQIAQLQRSLAPLPVETSR